MWYWLRWCGVTYSRVKHTTADAVKDPNVDSKTEAEGKGYEHDL